MPTSGRRIAIIGAGPGGLSAAMILAHRGHHVTVYEKQPHIGGRNAPLRVGDFTFETGPTFVMLPEVFREVFDLAGEKLEDHLEFRQLDPMYHLRYADGRDFAVHFDKKKLKAEIERIFPGESATVDRYFADQSIKFERLYKCLRVPYLRAYHYFRWKMLHALPVMDATVSIHDVLSRYFKSDDLKIAMGFQAKYLGMSPWDCPGAFTIISYIEHAFGIYHPMGGVHRISDVMAEIAQKRGAQIRISCGVKEILFTGKKATGLLLENGERIEADDIVMNADFSHGMKTLIPQETRPRWFSDQRLSKKSYSCSTFMLYLGVDGKIDLPHHSIVLSADYRKNVEDIFHRGVVPTDPSFYLQNASVTDPSLAPEGKSTLYVLVPVPNLLQGKIDWKAEGPKLRRQVLDLIAQRTNLKNLERRIDVERIITPSDWENSGDVYAGAVFNLSHSLDQMLYLRPHNALDGFKNLYIVGGGTHPGSGLPTIIESGRITADLISPTK